MSYGAFGSTTNTFANGAVGGTTPVGSSDVAEAVGNIMCFPFKNDLLDTTGNHTIDSGSAALGTTFPSGTGLATRYTYDDQNMMIVDNVTNEAPVILASTQAHQIPHSSPVSFGCFVYMKSQFLTVQCMRSGIDNSGNYGFQLQTSAGWRYTGSGTTNMGDNRDNTPTNRWFHLACVVDSTSRGTGSNPTEFYINGQPVWTGNTGGSSAVSSTDNFAFCCASDELTSDWDGFMANVFVSDNVLDPATIKALSDECFGHASPIVR